MGRAPWRARLRRPHARRSQARDRAAKAPGGTPVRRTRTPADAAPRRGLRHRPREPERRHGRPQPLEVAQVRIIAADDAENRNGARGQPLQRDHLRRIGSAHRGERARVLGGERLRRTDADLLLRRRRLVRRPQADDLRAERPLVHLRRLHIHAPLVRLRPAEPARGPAERRRQEALRPRDQELRHDVRAHRVADHMRPRDAEVVHEPHGVEPHLRPIGGRIVRLAAAAMAARV